MVHDLGGLSSRRQRVLDGLGGMFHEILGQLAYQLCSQRSLEVPTQLAQRARIGDHHYPQMICGSFLDVAAGNFCARLIMMGATGFSASGIPSSFFTVVSLSQGRDNPIQHVPRPLA